MSLKMGNVIHLGVVVRDVEEASRIYEKELGIGPWEIADASPFFDNMLVNGSRGLNIRTAICRKDGYEIELCQPTGEGLFKDWLEKHGPGVHHVKLESDNGYKDVVETAERISGRKPYLDVRWPNGDPLVAYADVQDELGLLLEIGAQDGK